MRCKRATVHDHGKPWTEDTIGDPLSVTARRCAAHVFCSVVARWTAVGRPPGHHRTINLRSAAGAEHSMRQVRQRYPLWGYNGPGAKTRNLVGTGNGASELGSSA